MDENKIVPTPEEEAENVAETEASAGVTTAESVENSEFVAEDETAEIEEAEADEEFTEDEVFADEEPVVEEAPKKKKKKIGAKIAIGLLVAIIAFVVFCFVYVYIAMQPPKVDFEDNAATISGVDISAAEFFLHCSSVQGSSADEIKQGALDRAALYNAIYAKAKSEGYKLPEAEQKSLDEQLASIQTAAQSAGKSVDEYVSSSVAKGFTFDMIKTYFEKEAYVNSYYGSKIEGVMDSYKGDDGLKKLEESYNKTKTDNDLADFSYWYFDMSTEGAEDKANAVADAVRGGKTLDEALKAVDEKISAVTVNKSTKKQIEDFNKDLAAWLYKTDDKGAYVNGNGAVEVVKDSTFAYVVYVNEAPSKDTVYPVTANYIKIAISADTTIKTAEMNKLEAKKIADKILEEFLSTDKSAEKMTEIATTYTKDNKSVTTSKFEKVVNDGTLDASLENWLFDEARKEKDVTAELIETESAYYILYFVEKAENAVWYDLTLNTLVSEKASELQNGLLAEGKKNLEFNEESVADVMKLIQHMSSSSSYGY